MFKISIMNTINNRQFGATFDTMEEANVWIASQESKAQQGLGWGYASRWLLKSEVPETHLSLIIEEEERVNELDEVEIWAHLDKEYTIEIVDLSQDYDYLLEECYKNRKSEYPSVEDLWEAFCDHGVNSQKWLDLMTLRQQIKNRYLKPQE